MRIFAIIYTIAMTIIAMVSTFSQSYPALYLIDLFAPNEGDTYSVKLVMLLTMLVLLIPLGIILFIFKMIRKSKDSKIVVDSWRTGIYIVRKTQMQSLLLPVKVIINGVKAGEADSGLKKFFDTPPGIVKLSVGSGKTGSEILEFTIKAGEQLTVDAEVVTQGRNAKQVLKLRSNVSS